MLTAMGIAGKPEATQARWQCLTEPRNSQPAEAENSPGSCQDSSVHALLLPSPLSGQLELGSSACGLSVAQLVGKQSLCCHSNAAGKVFSQKF